MELLVLPRPHVVATAQAVTDAEQDVLVAETEQIRTGNVLGERHTLDPMREKVADVAPLAVECARLGNARALAAEDGVVAVAFMPPDTDPRTGSGRGMRLPRASPA